MTWERTQRVLGNWQTRETTFTSLTSHLRLLDVPMRVTKFGNYILISALPSTVAWSHKIFLPYPYVRGYTKWSGSRCDNVKRKDEKSKWCASFSPVFIWSKSESIQRKVFSIEPLRETWPWGLPENYFSQLLSGWGPLKWWLFWLKRTGCLLYIMIPVLMAPGNVWSQMEFSIEFNLCVSQCALGTSSFIAYSQRDVWYGCFILILQHQARGPGSKWTERRWPGA